MYIHELKDWPRLHWDTDRLAEPLASVRHRQGRLLGRMESMGFSLRQEAVLRTLTADVLKSSEIEGEKLDADQVRSDRKSTRLNSSHLVISYAVFCLKKKKKSPKLHIATHTTR